MTVHARGYRGYSGGFGGTPAALAIARETHAAAWRSLACRRIRVVYIGWFLICSFLLYMGVGSNLKWVLKMFGGAMDVPEADMPLYLLDQISSLFFSGVAFMTAVLAVFIGPRLISDDLASGALPLYLVRPIRASQYVWGKALVLPLLLLWAILLPGLFFWLLVGLWQPPGESFTFLANHLSPAVRVLEHYALAALAYSGLCLLFSSRTPRRTTVVTLVAAAIFVGVFLQGMAQGGVFESGVRDVLLHAGLPGDTMAVFARHIREAWPNPHLAGSTEPLPHAVATWILVAALFALGFFAAWRRARTVEVIG